MIGVYDYTVVLTYMSLISGVMGIIISVTGVGHPEIGIFFLMLSGVHLMEELQEQRKTELNLKRILEFRLIPLRILYVLVFFLCL